MPQNSRNILFEQKWSEIIGKKRGDEFTLFVPKGKNPASQRQFNLYHYYQLIERLIRGKGYTTSIEFGCGRGTISLYLNKYSGIDVSLFDLSEDGTNLARANFEYHGAHGHCFVADSAKVPVSSEQFDLVVSIGLLEHLPNYEDTLREMYRVMRRGGMLITMNIPKKKSIQELNNYYKKILSLFSANIKLEKDYFRVSDQPEIFKQKAGKVGFKDCYIIHTTPFPIFTPVPGIVERLLARVYRAVIAIRGIFKEEPMEGSRWLSQCHFLIGRKP
jgi:ubiquinone/menaquinone biosynthesis C-methylase UbiE